MTPDEDPLVPAVRRYRELERAADQAKSELIDLVRAEAARGVPRTVIGQRLGMHTETVRRWLKR